MRVLTLDDSREMGELIALILEGEGYECLATDDSYEAWALLHTLPFDVLTQDTMRPDIDGVEFYHLVRADPSLASLAVVTITAVPPDRNPDLAADAALDAYLTKPFRPRELTAAVAEAVESRGKQAPDKPGKRSKSTPAWLFRRLRGEREVSSAPLLERLTSEEGQERLQAARALGIQGDVRAVEPLLAALSDPDASVRWAAALALARIGAEGAVEPLARLLPDHDERVRAMAARALGKLGGAGTEAMLVQRLEDESEWVRRAAMQALGEVKAPEAVGALARVVRDTTGALQQAAARALGQIGKPAVEALIGAVCADDPAVRGAAILGLSRVEEDERVDEALIAALDDEEERVREAAAHALGDRDPEQVIGPLVALLHDRSPNVAAMAATALAWVGAPDAIPALERVAREDTRRTGRGEPVAEAARAAIRWIKSNR